MNYLTFFLNIISNSKDALVSNVDKNDRIIKIVVNSKKKIFVCKYYR